MAGIRKSSLLIVSTLMFTIIITSNVNARPQVRPHRSWNSDLNLNMIPESDDTRVKFHDDSIIAKEHRRVKKNMNNIESAVSSTSEKQDKSSGIQGETSNSESMTDSNSLKSEMPLTNQDAKREVVSNDKDPKIGSSTGIQSSNKSVSKLSSADGDVKTSSNVKSSVSEDTNLSDRNEISKSGKVSWDSINNENTENSVKEKQVSNSKIENVDSSASASASVSKSAKMINSEDASQDTHPRANEINSESNVPKQENEEDSMKDKSIDVSPQSSKNTRTAGFNEDYSKKQDDSASYIKESQKSKNNKMIGYEKADSAPSTDSNSGTPKLEKIRNSEGINNDEKITSSSTSSENAEDSEKSAMNSGNESRQPRMRSLQNADISKMENEDSTSLNMKTSSYEIEGASAFHDIAENENGATHSMYPKSSSSINSESEDGTEQRAVDRQGKYLEQPPSDMQSRTFDIGQMCMVPCSPVHIGNTAQVVSPGLSQLSHIGSGIIGHPFSVPLTNPHIASALGAGISHGVSTGIQFPHGIPFGLLASILSGHTAYSHHGHGAPELLAELPPLHFPTSAALLTEPTYLDFTLSSPLTVQHDSMLLKPPFTPIRQTAAVEVHPSGTILHDHEPQLQMHYHPHLLNNY